MKFGRSIRYSCVLLLASLAHLRALAVLGVAVALLVPVVHAAQPPVHMRAMHFGGYWAGNPTGIKALPDEYFQYLTDNHVEWLGISVAMFTGGLTDATVRSIYAPANSVPGTIYTFDDADLLALIAKLKSMRIKVYLTLAFENASEVQQADKAALCGTSQYPVPRYMFGETTPYVNDPGEACLATAFWWWHPSHPNYAANVAQFWSTYTQVAVKYAALAQQAGVDMFSLGTETDRLFRTRNGHYPNNFADELARMVGAARSVYSGALTYDQVYSVQTQGSFFDGSKALFQDLGLDVVGVSAYFPLSSNSPKQALSPVQLDAAWESVFANYLIPLQAANPGTPIVFLEFGYTDSLASPAAPSGDEGLPYVSQDLNGNQVDDGREQQSSVYQAFFDVNARHGDIVRGAFLWGNGMSNFDFDRSHRGFKLQSKPAELTVRGLYGNWMDQDRLFSWAEAKYSQFFQPPTSSQNILGYTARAYSSGVYLGVLNGEIDLYGPPWGGFFHVGKMADYMPLVAVDGF